MTASGTPSTKLSWLIIPQSVRSSESQVTPSKDQVIFSTPISRTAAPPILMSPSVAPAMLTNPHPQPVQQGYREKSIKMGSMPTKWRLEEFLYLWLWRLSGSGPPLPEKPYN